MEILDSLAIESNPQKHEFVASTYSCSSSEFAGPRLGFHDCGACEITTKNYSKPFFSFPVAKSSQEEGTRRRGYCVTWKARREKGSREVIKKPSEKKRKVKQSEKYLNEERKIKTRGTATKAVYTNSSPTPSIKGIVCAFPRPFTCGIFSFFRFDFHVSRFLRYSSSSPVALAESLPGPFLPAPDPLSYSASS